MTDLIETVARAIEAAAFDIRAFNANADYYTQAGDFERRQDRARAKAEKAIRAIEAAGWALVPKVPTEEAINKIGMALWIHEWKGHRNEAMEDDLALPYWRDSAKAAYAALLAAAPKVVP